MPGVCSSLHHDSTRTPLSSISKLLQDKSILFASKLMNLTSILSWRSICQFAEYGNYKDKTQFKLRTITNCDMELYLYVYFLPLLLSTSSVTALDKGLNMFILLSIIYSNVNIKQQHCRLEFKSHDTQMFNACLNNQRRLKSADIFRLLNHSLSVTFIF